MSADVNDYAVETAIQVHLDEFVIGNVVEDASTSADSEPMGILICKHLTLSSCCVAA